MITKTYTDPQGVTHENAVFQVGNAHKTVNSSESLSLNAEGEYETVVGETTHVHYHAQFWTSQEAKDAGKASYSFSGDTSFQETEEHAGLTLLESVEAHLLTLIGE